MGWLDGLFSPGSETTSNSQTTAPTPEMMAAYQDFVKRAQGAASTPFQTYGGPRVAGFTGDQTQAFQGMRDAQGIQTPYINQATQYANDSANGLSAGNINSFMSPYQQNVIDATMRDVDRQDTIQQNNLVGSTVGSGGLNNSRLGVMQAELAKNQGQNRDSLLSGLNQQNYSQAIGAAAQSAGLKGQGAFAMGNLGNQAQYGAITGNNALLNTGGLQQQLGQAQLDVPYSNWQQQQQFPYAQTQWLGSQLGSIGPMMGSTTTGTQTTPTASPFQQIMGGGLSLLGGWLGKKADGGRVGYADGGAVEPSHFDGLMERLGKAVHHAKSIKGFAGGGMVPFTDPGIVPLGMQSMPTGYVPTDESSNLPGGFSDVPWVPHMAAPRPSTLQSHPMMHAMATHDRGRDISPMPDPASWSAKVAPEQADTGGSDYSYLSRPLMAAGFSMMADRTPNIGVALGHAGMAGLDAYDKQNATERQGKVDQSKIDMEAQRLQQSADQAQASLRESSRHNQAVEGQGKYQFFPATQTDENGNAQMGVFSGDTRTGNRTFEAGTTLQGRGTSKAPMTEDEKRKQATINATALTRAKAANSYMTPEQFDAEYQKRYDEQLQGFGVGQTHAPEADVEQMRTDANTQAQALRDAQHKIEVHNSKLTEKPIDQAALDRIHDAGVKGHNSSLAAAKGGDNPPMPGARKAPNGKWYVQKGNQYFEVQP